MRVPAYDKSLYGGRGDRIPQERWPTVEGPIDVMLLEGCVEARRLYTICVAMNIAGVGHSIHTSPCIDPDSHKSQPLTRWMLGFRPLPPDAPALAGNPDLKAVNALLGQYEAWHELVEAWVVVQVDDVEQVHAWRLEAERRMRERRGEKGSLSDEEVKDFVSRFLPAYRAFLAPSLFREEEGAAAAIDGKPTLRFSIDAKRRPKS